MELELMLKWELELELKWEVAEVEAGPGADDELDEEAGA